MPYNALSITKSHSDCCTTCFGGTLAAFKLSHGHCYVCSTLLYAPPCFAEPRLILIEQVNLEFMYIGQYNNIPDNPRLFSTVSASYFIHHTRNAQNRLVWRELCRTYLSLMAKTTKIIIIIIIR